MPSGDKVTVSPPADSSVPSSTTPRSASASSAQDSAAASSWPASCCGWPGLRPAPAAACLLYTSRAGPASRAARPASQAGRPAARDAREAAQPRRAAQDRQTARPGSSRRPAADPARTAAFDVLRAVAERDAYANLMLPSVLRERGLAGRDAALATELAYGTLRGQGTYDAILAVCSDRDLDQIDLPVRQEMCIRDSS